MEIACPKLQTNSGGGGATGLNLGTGAQCKGENGTQKVFKYVKKSYGGQKIKLVPDGGLRMGRNHRTYIYVQCSM